MGEDVRLQAASEASGSEAYGYGSPEDEIAALKSLSAVELDDEKLKEIIMLHFTTKCRTLSEVSTFSKFDVRCKFITS